MFRFPEGKVSDSPRVIIRFPKEKLRFLFLPLVQEKGGIHLPLKTHQKLAHSAALNRYIFPLAMSPFSFDKKIGLPKICCEKFVNRKKLVFSMEKPIISTTRYQ